MGSFFDTMLTILILCAASPILASQIGVEMTKKVASVLTTAEEIVLPEIREDLFIFMVGAVNMSIVGNINYTKLGVAMGGAVEKYLNETTVDNMVYYNLTIGAKTTFDLEIPSNVSTTNVEDGTCVFSFRNTTVDVNVIGKYPVDVPSNNDISTVNVSLKTKSGDIKSIEAGTFTRLVLNVRKISLLRKMLKNIENDMKSILIKELL